MIALLAALALAEPAPHAAMVLHGKSEHLALTGERHFPVGVPVPLSVRSRHTDRSIRVEAVCDPVPVRSDGTWLAGAGTRGPVRRLGPEKEGVVCWWSGAWTDGTPAAPGTYGLALSARIDGDAVVAGGGTVAQRVELVAPEPLVEGEPVRIPVKRGYAVTPDGRLVIGFEGPGLLQPGVKTAELRAWLDGRRVPLFLSRAGPDDPLAERVVAGWRLTLEDVFPEGEDVVVLTVQPR